MAFVHGEKRSITSFLPDKMPFLYFSYYLCICLVFKIKLTEFFIIAFRSWIKKHAFLYIHLQLKIIIALLLKDILYGITVKKYIMCRHEMKM